MKKNNLKLVEFSVVPSATVSSIASGAVFCGGDWQVMVDALMKVAELELNQYKSG